MDGRVLQVNLSPAGVPRLLVGEARILLTFDVAETGPDAVIHIPDVLIR